MSALAVLLLLLAFSTLGPSTPVVLAKRLEQDHFVDCPPYGCPLLPLDVTNDLQAQAALAKLRRSTSPSSPSPSAELEETLHALQGSGDATKAVLTLKGYKGGRPEDQINQDRAVIHSPFWIAGHDDQRDSGAATEVFAQLMGVFDGHGTGGELTSNFAIQEVPRLLAEILSSLDMADETAVSDALRETFLQVDRGDPSEGRGGCTATVILQLGSKVFVANAGDSVSFVGVHFGSSPESTVEVVYQTREDKPDLPDERKRILEAGGYVHIPSDPNDDVPRAYHVDAKGQARYGLAMSRSLGDWHVQGVIAEPIVDVLDLLEIKRSYLESCRAADGEIKVTSDTSKCDSMDPESIRFFAVSLSDGMADYLETKDVAETMAASLFRSAEDSSVAHPLTAAESLIHKAARIWNADYSGQYRDDIALAAATLPLEVPTIAQKF